MATYKYGALKDRMRELEITQESLAELVPMGYTSLNLSLNNKRKFRQDEMVEICRVLEIPLAEIDRYFLRINFRNLKSTNERSGNSMRKPTTEEILAIDGSVPVEMAARYLGQSKDFIYCAMQKQVLPIGTAYLREKEWCYDIRPQALVEYNEHGGVKRYMALEDHLRKVISCTVEKLCS